jgi:uncharacterized protein DUF2800
MAQGTAPLPLDTEVRAHHEYSPSSLPSTEACPCFKSRENKHVRTIAGTIAHKVTETREDDNRLDDDDAAHAAECLDFYDSRRAMAIQARENAIASGAVLSYLCPEVIELMETYLATDDIVFPDGVKSTTAGYVDRVLIMHTGTYAELFDWKFGMWPVEKAENNLQGIAYTVGLFRKYLRLESARFWFKQPTTGQISHSLFTREMLGELFLRVQVVVARARKARELMKAGDFSMANPMVPNCNFCANIADCTKVLDFALRIGKKFHPLEIPENITPTMVHNARDTKLGMALSAVMAVWSKAYRTRLTDRVIRRDADVPEGFTIQQRADREVKDPVKLKEIALQYMTPEQYNALLPQEPPFGPMEEIIKDQAPRGAKKAAVEEFQTKLIESGAVEKGSPYTFLRAVAKKDE